jgi:hypothetical protein
MAEQTTITVTIRSYEKFKGRKDVENPNWFKCSNRLLEDPDFYRFTHEEINVWVQILSLVSRKKAPTVTLDFEHCERVCRLSRAAVESAIEKLRALNIIIGGTSTARPRNVRVTSTARPRNVGVTLEEKREEKSRVEKKREERTAPLDLVFESLYRLYPRHEDRDEAKKRFDEYITPDALDEFTASVTHYAAICKRRQTEPKFIKLMASFIGSDRSKKHPWTDYVKRPNELDMPSTGKGPPAGALQRDTNPTDEFTELMSEGVADAAC